MKKSIKVMTLSLLAVGMLAGCSSESPNWKSEYLKFMKENFYGEALPYAKDFKDFEFNLREADGSLIIRGDNVTLERLAEYASLFKEEKGWKLQYASMPDEDEGEGEDNASSRFQRSFKFDGEEAGGEEAVVELPLAYTFEKEFDTDDGKRYVEVQFGNVNEEYEWTADGSFLLFAGDPYEYSWPADEFEVITLGKYGSDKPVPQFAADRYQFQDGEDEDGAYALAACYTSDKEAAVKYTATLAAATGWHVYGEIQFSNGSAYIADSPDGKYGLQYSYNEEEGYLIIVVTAANYLYSFPSTEANAFVKEQFNSEVPVPVLPSDYYRWYDEVEVDPTTGEEDRTTFVLCYLDSDKPDAGYSDILEAAGFFTSEYVEEGTYFAYSSDKAYVVYYAWIDEGFFGISFIATEDMLYSSDSWSTLGMDELFALYEEVSYSDALLPLTISSASAKFITLPSYDSKTGEFDSAEIIGYNITVNEYVAHLQSYQDEGWSVTLDQSYYQSQGILVGIVEAPVYAIAKVIHLEFIYYAQYNAVDCYMYVLESMATEFPTELNELLVENELPVIPEIEAQYYYFDSAELTITCLGVNSEEADAGYSALLANAEGWTLRNADDQGAHEDPFYEMYIADSDDGSISCYYSYQQGMLIIGVSDALPFARTSWPTEDITAIYAEWEETEIPVPAVEAADAFFLASAVLDDTYASWGFYFFEGVEIDVYGATQEEATAYLTETLPADGWTVDVMSGTATKTFDTLLLSGTATLYFGSTEDGGFYLYISSELEAIKYDSFPAEKLAAAFEAVGSEQFPFPAPTGASVKYSYTFDPDNVDYATTNPSYCYDTIYVYGITQEEAEAYREELKTAGWDVSKIEELDSDGDYYGAITKHFGEEGDGYTAKLNFYWTTNSDGSTQLALRVYYIPEKDVVPWPAEQIAAYLEEFAEYYEIELTTTSIPEYTGEYLKFGWDSYYGEVVINVAEGKEYATIMAYGDQLEDEANGWTYYDSDNNGMYYISPAEDIMIYVYMYSGYEGQVFIGFKKVPVEADPNVEKVIQDIDVWAFGDEADFDDDFNDPTDAGVISMYYAVWPTIEDMDASEAKLTEALLWCIEDEEFPEYLTVYVAPAYNEAKGIVEVYLIDEEHDVIVYAYAKYNSSYGEIAVSFQAGPLEAYFPSEAE